MIDYLPGGHRLKNAFTEVRTEPSEGAAAYPGAIGYQAIFDNGYPVGYTVSAMGVNHEEVLEIIYYPD